MPRFTPCSSSPAAGREQQHEQVDHPGDRDFGLADADRLDDHDVEPGGLATSIASRVRRATPPSVPPDGDGRMNARLLAASRSMRVLSPRIEPPLRVLDGSTASTASWCPASSGASRAPR